MRKTLSFAMIFLVVLSVFSGFTSQAESSTSSSETVYPWSTYRHDNRRTGYTLSIAPNTNNTLWKTYIGGRTLSSPAVVDGKVFIGSHDGYIYALDQETGEITWRSNIQAGLEICSSPAVAYGKVFYGSDDEYVYAVDKETGNLVWRYFLDGTDVMHSTAVANGKVFISAWHGYLYCLDEANGNLIWRTDLDSFVYLMFTSSPTVADGKVFIQSAARREGEERSRWYINCLDEDTGDLLWFDDWAGGANSAPVVMDGKVFVASDVLYCLDEENGSILWQGNIELSGESSPAIAYGKIFVGGGTFCPDIYAFNKDTGNLVWKYETISRTRYSSPAVADGKVFIGEEAGYIYALDAETGELVWKYQTEGEIEYSSPAVADGKVFIGSEEPGYVYAFGDPPPWTYSFDATKDMETYQVSALSNSTLSNFNYNSSLNEVSFNATGPSGTVGFSNTSIPIELGDSFQVLVDGSPVDYTQTQNASHYFLYFTYYHSTRIITIIVSPSVQAGITIDPETLNLKSNGQWITAYVTLPEGYSVGDIDIATVELVHSDFALAADWAEVQDSVLMTKFDRAALRDYIGVVDVDDGDKFYDVTLTVAGMVAGTLFEGSDTITVKSK